MKILTKSSEKIQKLLGIKGLNLYFLYIIAILKNVSVIIKQ